MRRLSFACQFVLLILIGCGVYRVANQYQTIEKQVNRFDVAAEEEHENIRVLEAEWAYLTNPVRLEKIGRDYFQLQPVSGGQTVAVNDIPVRAALDAQQGAEVGNEVAQNDVKPTAPKKSLPPSVVPVQDTTTVATALPQAANALPPMIATPVSDQQAAR